MLRSDGWGWRARIGLLVPGPDLCPEAEFQAMSPEGVSIHATRVRFPAMPRAGVIALVGTSALRAYLEPTLLDDAAELMASAPIHAIALCFTNTSFLGSVGADQELIARLERRTNGVPVILTCLSALEALKALGAKRIAFVNPPWVESDITRDGASYFRGAGLEVVLAESIDMPRIQGDMHPDRLYEWIRMHVPASADAVFVGGNGLRAIGTIETLEEDLRLPVLTANQVLLWHGLRLAGTSVSIRGYGRIFEVPLRR